MPTFPVKVFSVGTTTVKLADYHDKRSSWLVVMRTTGQESGNTGTVWVNVGSPPQGSAGNTASGTALSSGSKVGENKNVPTDQVSVDAIYAVGSTSGQIIEFYESVSS